MSAPSHVQRCREWIREQIEAMGTLRTSNSRDLSFKSWRQNAVTVMQRIWPDDQERVERFRRISFTAPHSRADAKLSREWFGKGLGESRAYLQSLLDIIDREGVPEPSATDREQDASSIEDEIGFPMLDLDDEANPAEPFDAPAPQASAEGGLGVTPGYTTPDEQGATPRDSRTPAPPSLSMHWKAPTPSGLRRRDTLSGDMPPALGEASGDDAKPRAKEVRPAIEIPRAPSLPPAEKPAEPANAEAVESKPAAPVASVPEEPARPAAAASVASQPAMPVAPKPAEPPKPVAAAPRPGMTVVSKPAEPAKPAAAAPKTAAPVVSRPAEPLKPLAAAPKTAGPVASKAAEPAKPAAAAPPTEARTEPGSRVEARGKNGRGKQQKKSGPRPKLKDLLGLSEFDSRTPDAADDTTADATPAPTAPAPAELRTPEPAAAPLEAALPPAPVASPPRVEAMRPPVPAIDSYDDEPLPVEDEEDRERATLDFMQNSPVFGVVGKPVHRRTDTTEFLDPDAVAVATLASDLGRLGVPDAMRASISARLLDVAKRLEEGGLDWALLRGTVTDAMQYPDLAKRLLPVLLPWLERAA